MPASIWINDKVDFKLFGITAFALLFCASIIWCIFYGMLFFLALFVIEFKQIAYAVLHIVSIALALLFAPPLTELFSSFNSTALVQSEILDKMMSIFLLWLMVQFFVRILIFPLIRGSFENKISKALFIISIIGVIAIFTANKVFDFSTIAADIGLRSNEIEPVIIQSFVAFSFLLLMSYINAWIRFPDKSAELHKWAGVVFLGMLTFGLLLLLSKPEAKYKDADGNEYDKYKNRI